ncbi:2304_t:CDS:2, partial [Rhizophagus irregularis]
KHKVILKKLENIESANRSWFEEAALHLNICIKWVEVALCYGITRNPLNDAHFL